MVIDTRVVIALLAILLLFIAVLVCNSGEPKSNIKEKPSANNGASSILTEASEILDSFAPPQQTTTRELPKSDVASPENPYTPYVTSVKIPEVGATKDDTSLETNAEDDNDPTEPQQSDITSQAILPTNMKRSSESNNQSTKSDMTDFFSDISSWATRNKTANEARTKASSIRQEAENLRTQARDLPDEERDALLKKAAIMEDYSNRISASRGSSAKLNVIRKEALNRSSGQ